MLLIGSRAAKVHLDGFRDPVDWDFIVDESELPVLYGRPDLKPVGPQDGPKRAFAYGRTYVEAEVASSTGSARSLLSEHDGDISTPFGSAHVASLDALFLLKRSHIAFRRMWRKHFKDYQVLQGCVGCVPERLEPVLSARMDETKARLGFRERNFSVSNDRFFGQSESRVLRVVPHDSIHDVVKFGHTPMFKVIKDDPGTADVSFKRFSGLPFEKKMWNMQEECMVLTIERYAIPARLRGLPLMERRSCEHILMEMCFNYLPFDFRLFCVDYFDLILRGIPRGFASKAMDALGVRSGAGGASVVDGHEPGRADAFEASDL